MTLLSAEKLDKRFNDQVILSQVSFTVNSGDHIGLVGKNGCGKTTLFELMVGLQEPDNGTVHRSRQCIIDYVEQEKTEAYDLTLFEYVASARQDLLDMKHEIARLEEHLTAAPQDKVGLERLGSLQNEYEHRNGFNFENEVKIILQGLGFGEHRFQDRLRNFSGGEKNRAGLARVLAGAGTLILLDEPTNHLDIESTLWLEEYLSKSDKSYIAVSHDRAFLHNTVSKVWELSAGKIEFYVGRFEQYLAERADRQRLHEHHFRHQQEQIARLEDFVRRNMAGQKTKQAQSKLKYLARIKRLPPPRTDGKSPTIRVVSSGRSYAHVVAVDNVTVGYTDQPVATDITFDLYRGDKIGLIGPNGSGKSTILKSLIGELAPIRGDIRLGNNVEVAYFDQELSDLDPDRTVLENLWQMDPAAEMGTIRSFLGRFGFSGEDSLKVVAALSGGEKTKLSLARLLYHPANFIIFDEPTNHLDLVSREALEEALSGYDGSLLVVSHDRYFLDRVVNKIFHLNNGRLHIYNGNYSYFREKTTVIPASVSLPRASKSGQQYFEFKEKSKQRARLKKEIQKNEARIAKLELDLEHVSEELNHKIPRNDWEKLHDAMERKHRLEEEILKQYDILEELRELDVD